MMQKFTDWLHGYLGRAKKRWIAVIATLAVFAPAVPEMLDKIQEVDFTDKSLKAAGIAVGLIVFRAVAVRALAVFVTSE